MLAVHTLPQAGRGIFQKSLNLTRLLQPARQQHCQTCDGSEVPVEAQEQTQANQGGLGTQPLPTAQQSLPPLRALPTAAPSMKKETTLFLLQRLLCYIKM